MQWTIDPTHSSIEFGVKHMGISTVRGRFREVTGTVELDEDGVLRGVDATIAVQSIDTSARRISSTSPASRRSGSARTEWKTRATDATALPATSPCTARPTR